MMASGDPPWAGRHKNAKGNRFLSDMRYFEDHEAWPHTGLRHDGPAADWRLETLRKTHKEVGLAGISADKVHKGCFVVLRVADQPRQRAALHLCMRDQKGDRSRLVLYNHLSPNCVQDADVLWAVFPDRYLVLVEPWVGKRNARTGERVLYCNNSTQYRFIGELSTFLTETQWEAVESESEWMLGFDHINDHKADGNKFFKEKKYMAAAASYTLALRIDRLWDGKKYPAKTDRCVTLLSNRSETLLQLHHPHLALRDAMAALVYNVGHTKSIMRLVRASTCLNQCDDALNMVERGLAYSPGSQRMLDFKESLVRRLNTLYCERQLNFRGMLADCDQGLGEVRILWPDYIGPVEVKESALCTGRGLFATRNFEPGDVILVEKALAVVYPGECEHTRPLENGVDAEGPMFMTGEQLTQELVWKLAITCSFSADTDRAIERLYPGADKATEDDTYAVQAAKVREGYWPAIHSKHMQALAPGYLVPCYALPRERQQLADDTFDSSRPVGSALFNHCSMINHLCSPNCHRFIIGDMAVVTAGRDIRAGTELTLAYRPQLSYRPERHTKLAEVNVLCKCERCEAEKPQQDVFLRLDLQFSSLSEQISNKSLEHKAAVSQLVRLQSAVEDVLPTPNRLLAKIHRKRGEVLRELGDNQSTLKALEKSVHHLRRDYYGHEVPDYLVSWYCFDMVEEYRKQGDEEKSREWKRTALELMWPLLCRCDTLVSFLLNTEL